MTTDKINYDLQPTVGSAFGYGWQVMKKYFLELFLVTIILGVLSMPMWIIQTVNEYHTAGIILMQIFGVAYGIFILSAFQYGAKYIYLKASRGEKFEVRDIVAPFDNYLNVILANLLVAAIVAAGFFMLVIPGIIFAIKLAFVPYLVMDRKLDPVEAVKESWQMTKGVGWVIFAMAIVSFFLVIAGLVALILGVIISGMWISVAFAALYYAQDKERIEGVEVVEIPEE